MQMNGIYATINMFPKTWGTVVVARPSIELPGRSDSYMTSFALSGAEKQKLISFRDLILSSVGEES